MLQAEQGIRDINVHLSETSDPDSFWNIKNDRSFDFEWQVCYKRIASRLLFQKGFGSDAEGPHSICAVKNLIV